MISAAFVSDNRDRLESVYAQGRRERLAGLVDLYPEVVTQETMAKHAEGLRDVRVIFSTWGMPCLTDADFAHLPALEAVFYGAGSVQKFARPLLERNITVVSAWAANAVPVAEFTLAQILLSCKRYWHNTQEARAGKWWDAVKGNGAFGETVAIIGAGMIGRLVIQLLKPFHLNVMVYDPYLKTAEAEALGVTLVPTLEEAFSTAYVVSNHVPNLPSTKAMMKRAHFAAMRKGATFINTGRGAQIVESDMIAVLQERPDLTALLDVTFPEPPEKGSPLYTLPNVHLSTHIAGSINDEVVRMADYVIEEFERWRDGQPLRYAVSMEMLETMA